MSLHILVIEDDEDVAQFLIKGLRETGFTVDHAATGKDGLVQALSETYDVMIVDRMLPPPDGLTIIETVRKSGNQTPILVLSALGEVDDRVEGLKAGGDDYLVKPFAFSELQARLEALMRRQGATTEITHLNVGDLELDLLSRKVTRRGEKILLNPREFKVLEFLMRHAGQVVTRTMLLEHVWEYHFDPQTNVIDVHISRLRQKIDKAFGAPMLQTIRGAGYKLDVAEAYPDEAL